MRHLTRTAKLGRTGTHRNTMLVNMVCSLIKHKRITTTLAKAKVVRPVAEKVMTLARKSIAREAEIREALAKEGITDEKQIRKEFGKRGGLHFRRLAVADLRSEEAAATLFKELAAAYKDRKGGYTRIIQLPMCRKGDAAPQAIIEWVVAAEAPVATATAEAEAAVKAAETEVPKAEEAPKA